METETQKTKKREIHKHVLRSHLGKIGLVAAVLAVILWAPSLYAKFSTRHERYDLNKTPLNSIPSKQVALVLGAGVYPDGTPTPYLAWRVNTAVSLYKAHRVQELLLSADNSSSHYNEPLAMEKLAIQDGVPQNKLVLDYAGYSTYDSCYRARAIFRVQSATIVTQGYHLPRAIMTCNGLGVPSIGVQAQHSSRDFTLGYIGREWLSTDKAVFQLWFKPKPTLLGPLQPIRN